MAKPIEIWKPFEGSQKRLMACPVWECLLHGNRGGGKAGPLSSGILTPKGWKIMDDMRVGSRICNPDETTQTVIGVYPQGLLLTYKVKMVDGGETYCSDDHLWCVYEFLRQVYPIIFTTSELIKRMAKGFDFYIDSLGKHPPKRRIKSIAPHKIEPCQCIKVNNPNGLYITDDMIVTHNTDALLMDFAQDIGKGYGSDYKGLLLREATTELGDVITKSKKWFYQIFPSAKYNKSTKVWTFDGGETLWLNYARVEDDYWQYHGHEYGWIGWEELTNHAMPDLYLKMMSCNRTANPNIHKKYRATCNPSGPGHQWVKDRFINKCKPEKIYTDEFGQTRTHIRSSLEENKALLAADPMYHAKLMAMTQDNKMLRDAWVFGSWDLITGGFFTDVWDKKKHVLPNFKIPSSWSLHRSFDWGSSHPWAVTYGFESNGEQPIPLPGVTIPYIPKGSVIIPTEIYGWNGNANEGDKATSQQIATRVLSVDNSLLTEYNTKCKPGPADISIFEVRDGTSIAANLNVHGCTWTKAYKGPGSRIAGWAIIRQMLGAAKRGELESPHLYFFEQAAHHIRTLPLQQRDKKKPEDIDSDLEDHCFVYDTPIITDKGTKFIGELVGTIGKVLTVNGEFVDFFNCRLTRKKANLMKVIFTDGHSVICTPDEKFLTTKGLININSLLTLSDTFCIVSKFKSIKGNLLCKILKELKKFMCYQKHNKSFVEKFIINVVHIFQGGRQKKESDYIERCMSFLMVLFQKGLKYTIKNKTLQKIRIVIWSYCSHLTIGHYMEKAKIEKDILKNTERQQKNGTKVKQVKNGITNIMKILKRPFIGDLKESAQIVDPLLGQEKKKPQLIVQENVALPGERKQDYSMLKENVKYVPNYLQSINTHQKEHVQVFAEQNYIIGIESISLLNYTEDVYCLEANKTHTFALGNGVIVSNCMDSLRYLLARKLTTMKRKAVKN
jgi:hypothetical protein